jgi:hypothetical protein
MEAARMTAYVIRRNRGPSLLDDAYAILRGEKKAKQEAEPAAPVKAAKKRPAAKKGARK